MPDRGAHPIEWLRGLALSLERLAVQGVASGAVRGAADELRAGLPEDLDAHARKLAENGVAVLERLLLEAARSKASPLETWSRTAAEGAVRGALEEFRRLTPEMRPMTQELLVRMKLWLDRSSSEAAERARVIHSPGDRMRVAAKGATAGAAEELAAALPQLAAPAADFASQVGRGFVRGAAEEVARQARFVGRSPVVRAFVLGGAAALGGAILAVLVGVRRR